MDCGKCGYSGNTGKYCEQCGNRLFVPKSADISGDRGNLKKIFLVYGLLLLYLLAQNFLFKDADSTTDNILEWCFYALIAVLAAVYIRDWIYLLNPRKWRWKQFLLLELFLVALAIGVNIIVPHLNHALGHGDYNYMAPYIFSAYPLITAIFHNAMLPAIFEEISLRGFVFSHTASFMSLKGAIWVTAFLFFMLHLSIVSVIWLFGIGLIFGYFRARYRTLWYGIIGHFTYNTVIVLLDYYSFYY